MPRRFVTRLFDFNSEGQQKSKNYYRQKARDNWWFWRLVLSESGITYRDARNMDMEDILEANAALDIKIEQQKKEMQKAKSNRRKKGGRR